MIYQPASDIQGIGSVLVSDHRQLKATLLVGGLEHFIFFHIYIHMYIIIYIVGIIIPTDQYFSEGLKPPTRVWLISRLEVLYPKFNQTHLVVPSMDPSLPPSQATMIPLRKTSLATSMEHILISGEIHSEFHVKKKQFLLTQFIHLKPEKSIEFT